MIMMSILLINILITIFILMINFFLNNKMNMMRKKFTSFECGFNSMSNSRMPFSIQFYMISIIFLIFDIEIMIFFPFIPSLFINNKNLSMLIIMIFIIILMIGLYLEYNKGALDWLK